MKKNKINNKLYIKLNQLEADLLVTDYYKGNPIRNSNLEPKSNIESYDRMISGIFEKDQKKAG